MAQRARLWMELRRRDHLLAQIGRRVDQEPVIAIRADRQRRLGASKVTIGKGGATNGAAAIPLRHAAAGRRSKNDDAHHREPPLAKEIRPMHQARGENESSRRGCASCLRSSQIAPLSITCAPRRRTC